MIPTFVSDHAVLRWLERVEGIDLFEIRERIRRACEIGMPDKDGYIHFGRGQIVIEKGSVVTVLAIGQRSQKSRTMKRRRARQEAA
jgi:hypothetical protein